LNDDRATIIAKVRGWINPKLQIEDVSNPDLSPNDVVIHVKGKTDADYFGYQSDVQYFIAFPSDSDSLSISSLAPLRILVYLYKYSTKVNIFVKYQ
jgi:hypothetical protein